MMKAIEVVVPCYNESENICPLYEVIRGVFAEKLPAYSYTLLLVNDGSSDDSLVVLKKLSEEGKRVKYLSFSRNFGHQLAVKARLGHSLADAVISTNCDQQHPPTLIPEPVKRWEEDNQVVATLHTYPSDTPKKKRKSSHHFYKLLNMLSGIEVKEGSAGFRSLDQEIVKAIREMNENEPFLRGIVPWVDFRQCYIPYAAQARLAEESKYTIKKMLHLATTGVTSFSVKPSYFTAFLGFAFSALSVFYTPYVIYAFVSDTGISGWVPLIMTIVFFGGLRLVILEIIGIHIGKIFKQTRACPVYIIQGEKL